MPAVQLFFTLSRQHMAPQIWEGYPGVPIMAPASTCYSRQTNRLRARALPLHCRPLAADSGGFAFSLRDGEYPFTPATYIEWLRQIKPDWAATMDYPCPPGTSAAEVLHRQLRTLVHANTLCRSQESWAWVPVLQGSTLPEYLQHARLYDVAGLLLPLMGIGSLVGRRALEVVSIATLLAEALPTATFHLFGVKLSVLQANMALPAAVVSADTAAWGGGFGTGIELRKAAKRERGVTQREYERDHLYTYKAKVDAALRTPKQVLMIADAS